MASVVAVSNTYCTVESYIHVIEKSRAGILLKSHIFQDMASVVAVSNTNCTMKSQIDVIKKSRAGILLKSHIFSGYGQCGGGIQHVLHSRVLHRCQIRPSCLQNRLPLPSSYVRSMFI
jgi:hypothetical protein